MLNKYVRELIRRAYYLKQRSICRIAKEECCLQAMAKALFDTIHYLSLFECHPNPDALKFSPAYLFAMNNC